MIQANYINVFEYDFGQLYCFDHYVISKLNHSSLVTLEVANQILGDIKDFYGKNKIVYISNRELTHDVDPAVYHLINSKTIIGIAIVGKEPEQRLQAVSEQLLYKGSFGYFDSIPSAESWAMTFFKSSNDSRSVG